eukprot:CAMPEP_0172483634 /NCGR_PEP_ID=MMETSP1066-20121228/10675_1 /TAXON_ID=671091 /ORGANISM="Coscinodiscus wailesii, Strain CCMP2513" /LENGTH=182 /DNA_ID=CAMNT_0013247599 /DNA_START=88 /DNA_END=636 /DNA_ORIENTATION=-
MFRLLSSRIGNQHQIFKASAALTRNKLPVRTLSTSPSDTSLATPSTPSIYDVLVKLTFIDPSGARRIVPARIGETVYQTATHHQIDLGPSMVGAPVEAVRSDTWTEPLYGEGATSGYDMVVLGGNGVDTTLPMDASEKKQLRDYWDADDLYPESRLASQIVVNKEMDGMVVYVPDRLIDDCP